MKTTIKNKFRKALTGILVVGAGFLISPVYGQAPQAIKYQGVARDNVGNELTFQNLGLRLSIVTDAPTGPEVYVETHTTTTNEFGLFNVEIGNGTTTDDFTAIDWGSTTHYLKVEMDETGGTNYQLMGTSQLLAVPYALYADSAGSAPGSAPQTLTFAGGSLSISGGNTVTLPDNVDDADADSTNEIQALTLVGSDLSITGGNTVTLSSTVPSDTSLYADSAGFADTADGAYYAIAAETAAWADTANYAWYADMAAYADTANYAWLAAAADSAYFAFDADTANYAWSAASSDTANFAYDADTANYAWLALNADTAIIAFAAGFANLALNANYADTAGFSDTAKYAYEADTAMYADTAGFALGPWGQSGTDIFYTQGNVGIGTNTPGAKLDIRINSTIPSLKLSTEGDFNPMVDFNRTNSILYTDRRWWTGLVGAGGFQIRDATANVPRMVIDTSGNVGIGTNIPDARLHVTSAADPVLFERTGLIHDNRFKISMTNQALTGASNTTADQTINLVASGAPGHTGDMAFSANADNTNTGDIQMIITNAGNVGIGTTTPDGKLAVRQTGTGDIFNLYDNTTNVFTVLDGGNVGIGNTAPTSLLQVSRPSFSAGADNGILQVYHGPGAGASIRAMSSTAAAGGPSAGPNVYAMAKIAGYESNATGSTTNLGVWGHVTSNGVGGWGVLASNGLSETSPDHWVGLAGPNQVSVFMGGDVGIGLTNPSYPLHVEDATTTYVAYFANTTTTGGSAVRGYCENNNSPTSGSRYGGYFRARYGFSSMIGVYGYAFGGSNAYGVFGYAAGSSGVNWAVYASGSAYSTGTWQASDERVKINVAGFDGALSRIGQLPVKTYHFDNEKYPTLNFPTQKQYGIMAQDLEKVFPEMVLESDHPIPDENGELTEETVEIKAVNYVQLIPVLVKAVQEQQAIIESQKNELESLKAEVSEIKLIIGERADNE